MSLSLVSAIFFHSMLLCLVLKASVSFLVASPITSKLRIVARQVLHLSGIHPWSNCRYDEVESWFLHEYASAIPDHDG